MRQAPALTTIDDLIGNPRRWTHLVDEGTTIALCGTPTTKDAGPNEPINCPDCLRILKSRGR